MADTTTHEHSHRPGGPRRIDLVLATMVATPILLALIEPAAVGPVIRDTLAALWSTMPFMLFAVAAIGGLKATGAEALIAAAFTGREGRMILVAAAAGALSPFCSCEVIPFIAALLVAGVPLSAVMAFWLASPLMDPAMFAITAGALGPEIATAKLIAAVTMAALAGFAMMALTRYRLVTDPLRAAPAPAGCCGSAMRNDAPPVWVFWTDATRRALFLGAARSNFIFLLKWMGFAYLIEALMIRYLPAEAVAGLVGGTGILPVVTATLVGIPAYLNGYAAPALVSGLLDVGMSPGAGLAFLIGGGVTCVPAAVAVWALVKPRVFGLYLGFGFIGAVTAGLGFNALV